jgi:hypothetical protein
VLRGGFVDFLYVESGERVFAGVVVNIQSLSGPQGALAGKR